MQLKLTPNDMMNIGIWDKYREINGISEWAINEGLLRSDEELPLTKKVISALKLKIKVVNDD